MQMKFLAVVSVSFFSMFAAAAAPALNPLQQACRADSAPGVTMPGVTVRDLPGEQGDLPYVEGVSGATGAVARIYYEPALAAAAQSKAACLVGMMDLLAPIVPEPRSNVLWSSMVISQNEGYVPVRKPEEGRWLNVFRSTTWDDASMNFLLTVMPHEETHHSQHRSKAHLPRWFQEGHASWAGLHVTGQVRPDLAQAERASLAAGRARFDAVHLGAWGGLKVKDEAIERQLSPEERALKAKDPSYAPKGPFRFNPDDLVEDNANMRARYAASLALFDGLEQRHGRAAVQKWSIAVLDSTDPKQAVPLAQQILGEDLAPMLK